MSDAVRPVVFLAFANDRVDDARYLRNLPDELRRVREALAGAVEVGLCEVVERANATVDEVLDVFQDPDYRDRVALFHFGGHAGGAELLLETPAGAAAKAHAGGLARFLGAQRGLELVFLNGCSSRGQVQGLLDAGVPAVVATSQEIDDAVATEFSARFYQALGSGRPLRSAYDEAEAAVQTGRGNRARATYCSAMPQPAVEERWPWELYAAPGAEERVARWSLPLAAGDPLFGLPPLPAMDLPPSPYKHLAWFAREDAPVFFGRGREIRELYEALTLPDEPPIVLLFGESGAGKSSLLAAGLWPRLEAGHEVVYARRDAARGLAGTLTRALGVEEGAEADLAAAWRAREAAAGKPLVVILDQVEEAWTRPLASGQEVEALAAALRSLFAVRETRPRGRLVLAFRKEWLAEALRVLDTDKLPRRRVEIQHLGRDGIAEAVAGPASTERLRRQYHLDVEPLLAAEIAGDLAEDAGAAVAPALQILLAKMWAVASGEAPGAPRFTLALYHRLKRNGILLDDFLEEQLGELRQQRRELVDSGLALDLLAHHTTPLGTAETRQVAEVEARYGGRPEVPGLLARFQDRYLLTGTAQVTRLAHDTLAPLVRRRFEASNLPGQRAARVLAQRAVGWAAGAEGAPLDEVDLGIVEQGESGMPAWTADERRLVEASRRERAGRRRRGRLLRAGAAAAALLIAAAAGLFWWQRGAALRATKNAEEIARVAVAGDWLARDPTRAGLVLLEVTNPAATAYGEAYLREVVDAPLSQAVLRGHEDWVFCAAFSPDGRRVVTASADHTARVWATDGSGEPVVLRGHQAQVVSAAFDRGGRRIVTAADDHTVRVWAADGSGEPLVLRGHTAPLASAAFSPDGRRVVTASNDHTARVWEVDGSGESVVLRGHEAPVESVAFSPDGRRIVTASEDRTARVWAADGSGEPVVLRGHEAPVESAAFSPDGKRLVTASHDRTARVWAADGSGVPAVLRGHEDIVWSATFSPDGKRVVTASRDRTARVWAADGSSELFVLRGHESVVWSAAFSPDGRQIVTAAGDSTARIWAADGSGQPVVLRGHEAALQSAAFSPDGRRVITAALDNTARVWTLVDSGEPVVLRGHKDEVEFAAFSHDSQRVVTASADGTARVWAADGSGEPVVLRGHVGSVMSAAFSPDGRRVVTASMDHTMRVWAADGSGEPKVFSSFLLTSAAFSPDGGRVVTASGDRTARVWAADGSGEPVVLRGHEGIVWSAAFSPNGRRIVTASIDKTARVWAADGSGEPVVLNHPAEVRGAIFSHDGRGVITVAEDGALRVWPADGRATPMMLRGQGFFIESAAFSPDGTRIVSASHNNALVWSADGFRKPMPLRGHSSLVQSAAFSPDGTRIVTASGDWTARVWSIDPRLLQGLVRSATAACLDPDFRVGSLGEREDEARAAYERCRRCVGPWRSRFDVPAIRKAPEAAWEAWLNCMET